MSCRQTASTYNRETLRTNEESNENDIQLLLFDFILASSTFIAISVSVEMLVNESILSALKFISELNFS